MIQYWENGIYFMKLENCQLCPDKASEQWGSCGAYLHSGPSCGALGRSSRMETSPTQILTQISCQYFWGQSISDRFWSCIELIIVLYLFCIFLKFSVNFFLWTFFKKPKYIVVQTKQSKICGTRKPYFTNILFILSIQT